MVVLDVLKQEGWFFSRVLVNVAAISICVLCSALLCHLSSALFELIPSPFSELENEHDQQEQQEPQAYIFADSSSSSTSLFRRTFLDYHFWIIFLLLKWIWVFHLQVSYAHMKRGSWPYALNLGRGHDIVEIFKTVPAECAEKPGKVWRVRGNPGWHPRLLVRSSPFKDGSKIFIVRNNDLVERVPLTQTQVQDERLQQRVPYEPRDFRHTALGWVRRSFGGLTFLEPMAILATGEMGVWKAGSALLSDFTPTNSPMGTPQNSQQQEMGSRENSPPVPPAHQNQNQQQQQSQEHQPRRLHRAPSAEELIVQFCFSEGAAADEEQ